MLKISSNEDKVSGEKEKQIMKKEIIGERDRLVNRGKEEGKGGKIVLHILTYWIAIQRPIIVWIAIEICLDLPK